MKYIKIFSLIALMLFVFSCADITAPENNAAVNAAGMIKVTISVGGNARTVLPTVDFDSYIFRAEKIEMYSGGGGNYGSYYNVGQLANPTYVDGNEAFFSLDRGVWEITVTAMKSSYGVARGSVTVDTHVDDVRQTVYIDMPTLEGTGTFSYKIKYDNLHDSVSMTLEPLLAEVGVTTVNIGSASIISDSYSEITLGSGIWLLTLTNTNGHVVNEIVHIYKDLTSHFPPEGALFPDGVYDFDAIPPLTFDLIVAGESRSALLRGTYTTISVPGHINNGYMSQKTANQEASFTQFHLNIGRDLKLFEHITFNYAPVSGDINYKKFFLLASKDPFTNLSTSIYDPGDEPEFTTGESGSTVVAAVRPFDETNALHLFTGTGSSSGGPITLTVDWDSAGVLDGEHSLYFVIYSRMSTNTTYSLENITFVPFVPCDECGEYPCICPPYIFGNPYVDGATLVHLQPEFPGRQGDGFVFNTKGAKGGIWDVTGGGLISYPFPNGFDIFTNYNRITIYYEAEGNWQGNMKNQYNSWSAVNGFNAYPNFNGTGSVTYVLDGERAFSIDNPGIGIQYNSGTGNIKITSIVFSYVAPYVPNPLNPGQDYTVQLANLENVKNPTAWTSNYQSNWIDLSAAIPAGFVISDYEKLTIRAKFFDVDNNEMASASGYGQVQFATGSGTAWGPWLGEMIYNLNEDTIAMEIPAGLDAKPTRILVQNAGVAYIQITEITFHVPGVPPPVPNTAISIKTIFDQDHDLSVTTSHDNVTNVLTITFEDQNHYTVTPSKTFWVSLEGDPPFIPSSVSGGILTINLDDEGWDGMDAGTYTGTMVVRIGHTVLSQRFIFVIAD
jgi:hypothetical protein